LQLRPTNTAYQPLPASQRARQVRVGAAAPPKLVATPSPFLSAINYRLQKVAAQQATQHFKLICLGDINRFLLPSVQDKSGLVLPAPPKLVATPSPFRRKEICLQQGLS
jgi:hypothetical protein